MKTPLQIAFHNLECSAAVKELIEEKVAWLEKFHDRIVGCRVVVEVPHSHRQGHQYQVRIDLTVPGGKIAVNREPSHNTEHRDLPEVIRDAFDAARRQLEEQLRHLRHEGKMHQTTRE